MSRVYTFNLPDIGEGVVEGEVIEWRKKVGDTVKKDEPIVVVMTDKATVELPSPYAGTLAKQYFQPGEIAIKDKPLYDISLEGDVEPSSTPESLPQSPKPSKSQSSKVSSKPKKSQEKALATPKVRHLAHELGIDVNTLEGTGKDGRVTSQDLRHPTEIALPNNPTRFPDDEEHALIGVRGLMARKMHQRNIPQFSYFEQADATRLIQLKRNLKEKAALEGIYLSYMPFFIKALSLTIKQYPIINSSVDMQSAKMVFHKPHHIGIAMATPNGLIVPVLKNVQMMSLEQIIKSYESLKSQALTGKLPSSEMKEATITVSNFGVLGGEGMWATPMISEPEVAILALARMRKAPVVKNNEIVIRDILPLSWSFDHRIIDGELAATISHFYSTLLRDPISLL